MAEPTLSLMWDDIRNSVYEEVFGGGTNGYTDETDTNRRGLVERYCESGYRQFLMPPPVEGRVHDWSFLMPAATLLLNAPYSNGSTNTGSYTETSPANTVTIDKLSITAVTTATPPEITTETAHGFSTGEKLNISNIGSPADGNVTATKVSATKFTITEVNGSSIAGSGLAVSGDSAVYQVLPDWTTSGFLDFDGVSYPVASRSANTIVLDSNDNPGADLSSKTFRLHQDDYDLPDDFGMLLGNFTFAQKDNVLTPCDVVGEARIRELRQRGYNSSSHDPVYAALRIKQTSNLRGDRWQVLFWPNVTAASTVTYRYRVTVDKPASGAGSANDYGYGVSQYSETILYSCLAEAERRKDGERGPMWQHFTELLQTSVMRDRQDNTADLFGYNLDYSDRSEIYAPRRGSLWSDSVTHKGQGT